MTQDTPSPQQRILEAALVVVKRDGPKGLSMEAVAREAGLSKSGLFHHYSSKEALLAAFVEYSTQQAVQTIHTRLSTLAPEGRAQFLRTIVAVAFPQYAPSASEFHEDIAFMRAHRDFMFGLLTTGMLSPELLAPIRELRKQIWNGMMEDELTGDEQLLLWLASHGLWFAQMLGLIDEKDFQYEAVAKLIVKRAAALANVSTEMNKGDQK